MKVARCARCGAFIDESWSSKERCPECSGPIDRSDIDIGGRERVPRVLNIVGAVLVSISLFVFVLNATGTLEAHVAFLLLPLLIAVPILVVSLVYQGRLKRESRMAAGRERRPRRKARSNLRPGEDRSATMEGMSAPVRASKIITGR